MANYGLSHPFIAERDKNGTYSNGFQCGKAVGTSVKANYNEGSLYGDNELQEYVKEFKDADVTMQVTTLPLAAATIMFGHTVSGNAVVYNTQDSSNYVGYGFYTSEKVGGAPKHVACWLPKVKFADTDEEYTTKGENIEFKTPSVSGKAMADESGNWRYKETFDTENEAIAWLRSRANIQTTVYTVTQTLTHVTSSLSDASVAAGSSLQATLTPEEEYTMGTVTVTMGGSNITATAYNSTTKRVSIANVTGNVVITATATN